MLSNYKNEAPVDYSFRILYTVKQEDTQWSIIYDITNLKVYFRFHTCSKKKIIDFRKLNPSTLEPGFGCDISDCECTDEKEFRMITKDENSQLIQQVLTILSQEIELTGKRDVFNKMAVYGNQYLE